LLQEPLYVVEEIGLRSIVAYGRVTVRGLDDTINIVRISQSTDNRICIPVAAAIPDEDTEDFQTNDTTGMEVNIRVTRNVTYLEPPFQVLS
jgi:hypothetical protein